MRSLAAVCAFTLFLPSLRSEEKIAVAVSVGGKGIGENLTGEVTSYVTQYLRSLGDVEIVHASRARFMLSVSMSSIPNPDPTLEIFTFQIATVQGDFWKRRKDGEDYDYAFKGIYIATPVQIKKRVRSFTAAVDGAVFEKFRLDRQYKELWKDCIPPPPPGFKLLDKSVKLCPEKP